MAGRIFQKSLKHKVFVKRAKRDAAKIAGMVRRGKAQSKHVARAAFHAFDQSGKKARSRGSHLARASGWL